MTTRMTNTIGATAVILLICAARPLTGPMQSGSAQTGRLNPRIGPAAPEWYKSIRDAKDWKNPYLVIRRDGIEVIVKTLASSGKTVAAADLEQTLIALPVTAWPYGRVVAVQEVSIRAGDRSDDKPIADNLEAALAILKRLEVTVDRWAS
jgi:hypothetical protein